MSSVDDEFLTVAASVSFFSVGATDCGGEGGDGVEAGRLTGETGATASGATAAPPVSGAGLTIGVSLDAAISG